MVETRFDRSIEVLAGLTRLRQICCDPRLVFEDFEGDSAKVDTIMTLVGRVVDAGEKVLVFSQFTSYLDILAKHLDDAGIPYFTLRGSTTKKRRLELCESFNVDATPVFLISLKAGGTGLNLTGATVVIHADPWWNEAATAQSTDRAHRIGQTKDVTVYKVICADTIEEVVRADMGRGGPTLKSFWDECAFIVASQNWQSEGYILVNLRGRKSYGG